ncbi:uncharacterized protein [Rutidosis leptorrhynchoides]|uniref:uncharacterized protein isoform X2 n=1 Tax=Rutidosis leptorrhynchoides TaxID=125765 RepID=UPI003A9910C8
MARNTPKCHPTVDPKQGCVWYFSGMFDHHVGHPHRKMLSDERHESKSLPRYARSQVPMLTFDEQIKSLNIHSKNKNTNVNRSLKGETSSSDQTMDKSFWKKIKSRYESPNKKKENPKVDTIVVLRPSQRVVGSSVDLGCRCLYLHVHQRSTSKQQIIKHTNVSFNDIRKKLRNAKKLKNTQKMKSFQSSNNDSTSKMEKSAIVPFMKKREPDVFIEAKKHLAERLRHVGPGAVDPSGSSSKRASRTLERVLLSSPKHESMASFVHAPAVRSPDHILDMWLDSYNIGQTDVQGCINGSRVDFLLDVSSPKANCKLENMDNDQFRENPSPVSVLDSFFTDNICSPTSTTESVELQIQPQRLDFEEHSSHTSSPLHGKTNLSSLMEDPEFISSYINDMYKTLQSNWEDFSAIDYPTDSSCDHKLLHDCVKEILVSLHTRTGFFSPKIRAFALEKDVVNEVMEQVEWHNGKLMGPRTLDVLVTRDIAKCGQWVDSISDRNDIVFELVDDTVQELIMEVITDILM